MMTLKMISAYNTFPTEQMLYAVNSRYPTKAIHGITPKSSHITQRHLNLKSFHKRTYNEGLSDPELQPTDS